MKKNSNSPYKKLSGRLSIFDSSALYEGDQHLLLVDGLIYHRYHRFYYHQIQGVQIAKTKRYLFELAIGFGGAVAVAVVLEFLAAFAGFRTYDAPVLRGAQILFAGPFVLFGVISGLRTLIFGPSQDVVIQTAVQRRVIPPLGQTRKARKVINLVLERVRAAQGQIESKQRFQKMLEQWGKTPALSNAAQTTRRPANEAGPVLAS